MSYFLCPKCGERSDVFGHGGARDEAKKLGVPFLGEVPLHMEIRETSDSGKPVTVAAPERSMPGFSVNSRPAPGRKSSAPRER